MAPKDRETAFQHLAVLYIKYIQAFRKLEIAYDQLVHPQKRRLLKEILVGVMGRVLELKSKIVEVELCDISNYSEILLDLKLIPEDLAVPIPRFILEEREKELSDRKLLLDMLGARDVSLGDTVPVFPEITVTDAIKMIQINERGRQGRLRAKYMRDIKIQAQREKDLDAGDDEGELNSAALKIQRVFRGYKARKLTKAKLREEFIFLGMASGIKDTKTSAEANRNRRKIIQIQHEEEYQAALVNTKEKISKVEGPDMKETMQDNFRQWYMEYKRVNGKFPDFPPDTLWQQPGFQFGMTAMGDEKADESGGDKNDASNSGTPAGKGGKGKGKGKDEKKSSAKKDDKGKKGKKGEPEEDEGPKWKYDESKHLTTVITECGNYNDHWLRKDDSDNFSQKHDQEIVKMDKRREVEAEIKNQVFEILKEELVNLKLAVDRSKNGKKGKKGKKDKKGKKGKGGKKGKKDKKGKKGKKDKDLTANRTMESLIEELIQTGILQRVLTEYCILPIGFPRPSEVPGATSMLLFGPHGSGKTMMVNAVATESGAHLFNLSPRNTAGQYVGKQNVAKMVHMVFKVAKAKPPAVIYIDGVEMIFAKKVPKDDTTDPKRIKKDLLKQMKALKIEDRVIVMATSYKPWDADIKALIPAFGKILYTPKPDYGSRFSIWREFISRKASVAQVKDINFSLLARMSDGLSAGFIFLAAERVLTERRLKLMRMRKLLTNEFIDQIVSLPPTNPGEDLEFKEWYEKTPLVKKRIAALTAPVDGEDEGKGKKGGDKKKKK
ncbi:Dynein regulatory complex protein 11 [Physocladia obscura]|uniref:Dynein regulatory complex protein 11 n=1 Tax=Physocladia obscura TaxID=109957 RepID=A0AAD5TEQ6_9FUNG|nr:Dynein regulatory complex protein 11 [Physocladia obscura]